MPLSPSHSPSLPQTLLVFSFTLAPSLPVGWGPQVGERGSRRRRQCLLFPHNNRGIHGHPAPHQSTETDGRNAKARGRTHEEEFRFPRGGWERSCRDKWRLRWRVCDAALGTGGINNSRRQETGWWENTNLWLFSHSSESVSKSVYICRYTRIWMNEKTAKTKQ